MNPIRITDANGDAALINPNSVLKVDSFYICYREERVPTWRIALPGTAIDVRQSDYDIDDIRYALSVHGIKEVPRKKPQPPVKEHIELDPCTFKRYDFKYLPDNDDDAYDFILDEGACYFMDGNPLEATAVKMPIAMAEKLYPHYGFSDPLRNLSWISIYNHTALLFNNRAE